MDVENIASLTLSSFSLEKPNQFFTKALDLKMVDIKKSIEM